MRYPGLALWLILCAVVVLTHQLLTLQGDEPSVPAVADADRPEAASSAAVVPISATAAAFDRPTVRPEWVIPDEHPFLPARFGGIEDELLASPMLHDQEFQREVYRWVQFWETKPTQWFPSYLERMTWFEQVVDSTLAAKDLPWSLRYLPVIESGYSPSAVSSAEAVGMWQFIEPTAEEFGIEVSSMVDDRRDPFVSTEAATDFLHQLREDFGSWFLALAAYNGGPNRVRRLLERRLPGQEWSDRSFWQIRHDLPKETREYVPNLIGAIIVASNPEAYGYQRPEQKPFEFDEVPVRGRFTFEMMARATGTSPEEIARLNPEYLRGETPAQGQVVEVRLPAGRAEAFRAFFHPDSAANRPPGSDD